MQGKRTSGPPSDRRRSIKLGSACALSAAEYAKDLVDSKDLPRERDTRVARRYLDLLRDALLDEHYLENELRIEHLLECIATGKDVDSGKLSDPIRYMASALRVRRQERRTGALPGRDAPSGAANEFAYAVWAAFDSNTSSAAWR